MTRESGRSGFFEELNNLKKPYPDQKRILPLKPSDYSEVFTQQIAQHIKLQFDQLAQHEQHDKMIELYNKIELLLAESQSEIASPITKVQYWYEQERLPDFSSNFELTKPTLVTNQEGSVNNFIHVLRNELLTADRIDIVVSFLRLSGLQILLRRIGELASKGKPIRVLTSSYLNITQPEAIKKLVMINGVQIRVFDTDQISFHTKAYIFHRNSGLHSIIIGSSNISMSALTEGVEWNVKLPAELYTTIYEKAVHQFESLWNDFRAVEPTREWIEQYERRISSDNTKKNELYRETKEQQTKTEFAEKRIVTYGDKDSRSGAIELKLIPNEMQKVALIALEETRKNGNTKGVIIAATGTGKTYLAAFDVAVFKPKRLLFLAHRDELLENARQSFIGVMGQPTLFGKLTGIVKEKDRPYLFSTVQTFHRELEHYSPNHFDYVIVDEFHHAEAQTYRKIIDYFQPEFLLGLTATPERMDGGDVLALCDYNVVYEIRLHQALDQGLLCPFHYFGLSDDTVNYEEIKVENGQFNVEQLSRALSKTERVDYIVEMINKFGHDGKYRKALGFCASLDHAKFMKHSFNRLGFEAECLTGEDTPEYRLSVIKRLESNADPLEFIFTVNVFNEGVDIPSLNLILFLRPTESATIFLQQLGRGLRKSKNKEFVTILDFIGNYSKSFLVPLALSGQTNHKAFDRHLLRSVVQNDFIHLPDGCYVDLEQIARQRILDKIDQIRMDTSQMLKNLYEAFKSELGKSPEIEDFLYTPSAPSLHYFVRKYNSWVETKRKMSDLSTFDQSILDNDLLLKMVRRLEQMLPLKWPYEYLLIQAARHKGSCSFDDGVHLLIKQYGVHVDKSQQIEYFRRAAERLTTSLKDFSFGYCNNERFTIHSIVHDLMTSSIFSVYLNKRLDFGIKEFRRSYKPTTFFTDSIPVVHYQNYTRDELIYLFRSNAAPGSWREGISKVDHHYLFFVTLRKGEEVAEQLDYNDYFMNPKMFHWQSANQTSHHSSRGQDYIHHVQRGISVHLFVRKFDKMYNQTLPFMYCGKLEYVRSEGDKPMNIVWRLAQPMPEDIYLDFIN